MLPHICLLILHICILFIHIALEAKHQIVFSLQLGTLFLERELFITGHVTFGTIFHLVYAMSYCLWACIHSTNVFLIIFKLSSCSRSYSNQYCMNLCISVYIVCNCLKYSCFSNMFPIVSKSKLLLYKSFLSILV